MSDVVLFEELIGRWKLIKADGDIDSKDGVEMIISSDGRTTYIIQDGVKKQIINLTFRLEGNLIITDQPSKPKEEITFVSFDQGSLLLEHEGDKSWFKQVD